MSNISIERYIDQLRIWNRDITCKIKITSRGEKIYKILNFCITAIRGSCMAIAAFLNTLIIGFANDGNDEIILILSSIALAVTIISILISAIETVFNPKATSALCGSVSKAYALLNREINVEILSYVDNYDDYIEYKAFKEKLLLFSNKEQLISIREPSMILTGCSHKHILTSDSSDSFDV